MPTKKRIRSLDIVEAGVTGEPKWHCDDCNKPFKVPEDPVDDERIQTTDGRRQLTLCHPCYLRRGSSVR